MASFFSRVTRYTPTDLADPRENRLTEVTAATLERVPGLPCEFAHVLLGGRLPMWIDGETRVQIDTQVHVASEDGHGYADLLLSFTSGQGDDTRDFELLVEVKHGAPESGNQLDFYSSVLADRPSRHSELVVLAGQEFGNKATLSDGTSVDVVHWQQVAIAFRNTNLQPNENAWLLREYLKYLDEEGLVPAGPLDLDAAMFAFLYPRADASFKELHGIALERVRTWGELAPNWGGNAASYKGPGTFHTFYPGGDAETPWCEDVVFAFQFLPDDEIAIGRTSLAFFAGAWFGKKAPKPSDDWFVRMAELGINRYPSGNVICAEAVKYPSELIGLGSIDEQGAAVGDWALGIFGALRANPPG